MVAGAGRRSLARAEMAAPAEPLGRPVDARGASDRTLRAAIRCGAVRGVPTYRRADASGTVNLPRLVPARGDPERHRDAVDARAARARRGDVAERRKREVNWSAIHRFPSETKGRWLLKQSDADDRPQGDQRAENRDDDNGDSESAEER
ncbi:hypothetical protein GCM10025869_12160 [Homoserinibacter gongjuensis]|uniref:Uncharacterized protein n=1 Tax=Homoserinibacter gongjuensis TaxID=1162968 RepID=A0ABQ6JQX7_9MICO|nr:hypothetical protein GCM10025869_12160 [Homoserinibacter gongjuensis]